MGRAIDAFETTRYPEALEALEQMETPQWRDGGSGRARYALYRGLAHLAVGEAPDAARWLARAQSEVQRAPEALSPLDRSRLETAWRTLGLMPGEQLAAR